MRTLRLRTVHACDGPPCPHCHLVEDALRRALGLAGYPMPEHVEGKPSDEAFVSASVTILVQHECNDHDAAHIEFYVDDERITLPKGGTVTSLQRTFARILEEVQATAKAKTPE